MKKEMIYRRTGWTKALFVIVFIIFAVLTVTYLYPLIWVLMNSFKQQSEYINNITGFPKNPGFTAYAEAFAEEVSGHKGATLMSMFGMTIAVATVGTIITVLTSSQAAYILAKFNFRGAKFMYAVVIFAYVCPIVGTLPAQMQFMKTLGFMKNSFAEYVGVIFLYSGGFGFNFILLHAYYKNLSKSYAEAAYIDGANDFQIYTHIILPLSKGSLVAVFIIQFIGLWNDYTTPAIFLKDAPTLAVGVSLMTKTLENNSNFPELFAVMVIVLLPIILIFSVFSKTIIENTTVGGLKG